MSDRDTRLSRRLRFRWHSASWNMASQATESDDPTRSEDAQSYASFGSYDSADSDFRTRSNDMSGYESAGGLSQSSSGSGDYASFNSSFGASSDDGNAQLRIQMDMRMRHWPAYRVFMFRVTEHPAFGWSILGVIFANTILMVLQTEYSTNVKGAWYYSAVDCIFLGIYVFEALAKIYVHRFAYFKRGWNMFDLIIVVTSFVDWIQFAVQSVSAFNPKIFRLLRVFRAVRALRALRALRAITFLKKLQIIVSALLRSLPAMGSTMLLLFLTIYVFAIVGKTLYQTILVSQYGSLGHAIFTLFALITIDDWFMQYEAAREQAPTMILFLITYLVLAYFILINLFIAVIVNNLQRVQKASAHQDRKDARKERAQLAAESKAAEEAAAIARAAKVPDKANTIEDVFGPATLAEAESQQHQMMAQYFMLTAALDNNTERYHSQHALLDFLLEQLDRGDDEEDDVR
eukprot:TRINITY_DN1170_c0_g1_i2.p1 TRINITY_DN1170_c0_g1~~TRINITY_DN1170_c0_g1_i2.p1  ORF type:complete len:461 (+),score=83.41 TRINITY_DN1170_c0_g1_i2:1444-2826(+)